MGDKKNKDDKMFPVFVGHVTSPTYLIPSLSHVDVRFKGGRSMRGYTLMVAMLSKTGTKTELVRSPSKGERHKDGIAGYFFGLKPVELDEDMVVRIMLFDKNGRNLDFIDAETGDMVASKTFTVVRRRYEGFC